MARTKKQTIDAATERKRQFQEEIHNQTLVENTKKGEKLDSSSSKTTNAKHETLRIRPSKLSNVVKEESSRMSSPSKSTDECNDLPQAVVRVTDICKSPTEMRNEDCVRKMRDGSPRNRETRDSSPRNKDVRNVSPRGTRDISPRCKETRDSSPKNKEDNSNISGSHKDHTDKNIFEVMEIIPQKKRSPKKTSSSPKSKDLEESLRALKSESERVRLEKSKKLNMEESPKHSPKLPSQGRRSPRNQSPNTVSQSKIPNSPESPVGSERQKINIFTDDIGKDLGKRIRSPRRLSEDMIALPIFSLRAKAGQSPKECAGFSKYADDGNSVGFADSMNCSDNIFKSPNDVNLSPCKKSSTQKSSEYTDTFLKQPNSTSDTTDDNSSVSKSQSLNKVNKSHDLSMASVCRDVVKEMASSRRDLFMIKDERKSGGGDFIDENEKLEFEELDSIKSDEFVKGPRMGEAGDASSVKIQVVESSTEGEIKPVDCNNLNSESDGTKPSLLCAMLVGGSNVAQDYSEKRQRYNPEVTEISDSETEQSRPVSPNPIVDHKVEAEIEVEKKNEDSETRVTDCEGAKDIEMNHFTSDVPINDSKVIDDCSEKQDMAMEIVKLDVVKDENEDADDGQNQGTKMTGCADDKILNCDEQTKMDVDSKLTVKEELIRDEGDGDLTEKDSDASKEITGDDAKQWKKGKIEFSSHLKKVNDDILRLLDIDIEDQFMEVPDTEEIIKETVTEKETNLYKLISDLCVNLKENPNACDTGEIDKIIETCPRGSVPVVSSSFCDRKWERIMNRLKHEKSEVKKSKHRLKREHMDADMENLVEKMSASTLQSTNEENNDNISCVSKISSDAGFSHISHVKSDEKDNELIREKKDVTEIIEKISEQNSCLMSTSSSSLNGSLCELDLDSMTHAATQALKVPDVISDSVSEPGTCVISCKSEEKALEEDKPNLRITRKFQKSKTCGDFSQELLSPSTPSKSGTLRRTNSSPQLLKSDTSVHSRSNSPSLGKDHQIKSKLGGKIPVPGTSYSFRSAKKTVRKPRLIIDTKPLDILSQFVNDEKESKDVFFSQDLQKFLWMPSNRMIVNPAIRNEISIADKTAEEAWEKRLQLMQEEEERQRKKDEEVDREYMKYEPSFDEVDGLLFMSFSSEAELLAHVRVEKALEWDKDDTMLRIARAKTFEETKATNGDMKGVKLKRLRGQHMRWKKYKRMYGHEVEAVLLAKEKNIPLEDVKIPEKTSDVSKIKGWKRKSNLNRQPAPEAKENELVNIPYTPQMETPAFDSCLTPTLEHTTFQNYQDTEENLEKKGTSSKLRRQFNFSDRKAHKQLFKELNMDWEDRMIHRKLGGWSLKGNRPKEFSQAAKKRELKESKALGLDAPSGKTQQGRSADGSTDYTCRRKKLVFPLITDRMARSCLQTLELSDDLCQAAKRRKRIKRFRGANRSINTRSSLPPDILPTVMSMTSTPQSSVATAGSLEKIMDVSTPEASVCLSESTINTTDSPSLSLDLPDETVMEGVEIISHASSPSVTENSAALNSPQVKSCCKPGCRYGCICHLLQSPVSKPHIQDCDKEFCRLGCICESLHPEQPAPSLQPHCGKPSCMLECCCSLVSGGAAGGNVEDNEDMPFLSSLKQRPRAGERFSNLPRREKTHRSAKNLDAITRKAMMLYETSEIYCEKVERVTKKKSESLSSPPTSLVTSCPSSASSSFTSHSLMPMTNIARTSVGINQNEPPSVELAETPAAMAPSTVAFSAVNLVTSEVATVTASHFPSSRSQLFPWRSKRMHGGDVKVDIEMDDVRQTMPVMEPSAHKRKRKSHPLSDEIFSVSSCARIQPYSWSKDRAAKLKINLDLIEFQARNFHLPTPTSSACGSPTLPSDSPTNNGDDRSDSPEMSLKISGVCTLSEVEQKDDIKPQSDNAHSQKDNTNAIVDKTNSKASLAGKVNKSSVPVTKSPTETCKSSISVKPEFSSCSILNQKHIHGKEINRMEKKAQQQNWHTSMVCLKARAVPKTSSNDNGDSDDVQEEDEVKLLEFAANCNWDRAKKDILSRVASCLQRGQYPQPRMMNVRDYVVEILPKAKQPSLIPQSLRSKLPGQMYSIRVRITKNDDSFLQEDGNAPVIDLSKSSPVKETQQKFNSFENNSDVSKNLNDNTSYASSVPSSLPTTLSSSSPLPSTVNTSSLPSSSSSTSSSLCESGHAVPDSLLRSSIGISGLNRICNANSKNPVNQQNSNPQQSKSAPGSRRSSIETFKDVTLTLAVDDTHGANKTPLVTTAAKPLLDLSKIQIISRPNPTGASTVNRLSESSSTISNKLSDNSSQMCVTSNSSTLSSIVLHPTKDSISVSHPVLSRSSVITTSSSTHLNQSSVSTKPIAFSSPQSLNFNKKVGSTAATSLLNPDIALRKERPSLKVPSFAVAAPAKSAISPTSVNELKYVQMVYEVEGQNEKKKTLIAVPISLTGATVDCKGQSTLSTMPILTVPKPGAQAKSLPITIAPRNKSKLPQVIPGAPVIMKLPQMNATNKVDGSTTLKSVQIIPLSSVSSLLTNSSATTKLSAVLSSVPIPSSVTSLLKKVNPLNSTCGIELGSVKKDVTTQQEGTSVTQSRDRPIPSTEESPPREIISSSSAVNNSCSQSNGLIDRIPVSSGDKKNGQVLEENKKKSLDDQIKDVIKTGENPDELDNTCDRALVSVDQNINSKTTKDVGGQSSGNPILLEASIQTAVCQVKSKNVSVEETSVEYCIDTASHSHTAMTVESHSELSDQMKCGASIESRNPPIKESQPSSSHTVETKENGHITKLSSEKGDNTFEVVDIDDLLVTSSSDIVTSESSEAPSSDLSSLDDKNERDQQQVSNSGTKRKLSPEPSEDIDCPPGSKKLRLLAETPGILDEDSNLSSLITASPQSYTSLQKSAFSSGRSSGSMEDIISSDEEIDVGENPASYQNRVEKAWENDHSSMLSKAPPKIYGKVLMKHKKREPQHHEKVRVEYHNLLERNRRAKLKELFDNLGNTIMSVHGSKRPHSKDIKDTDGVCLMPKATILTEAKSTILFLNEKEEIGRQEIRQLMSIKDKLFTELKELKAQLLTNNVSGRAIAAIINKVTRKRGKEVDILNEDDEHSSQMKLEYSDDSTDITPDPTNHTNTPLTLSQATDLIIDTSYASADVKVESPPVYIDNADNVICTEEPVEVFELEFHPV